MEFIKSLKRKLSHEEIVSQQIGIEHKSVSLIQPQNEKIYNNGKAPYVKPNKPQQDKNNKITQKQEFSQISQDNIVQSKLIEQQKYQEKMEIQKIENFQDELDQIINSDNNKYKKDQFIQKKQYKKDQKYDVPNNQNFQPMIIKQRKDEIQKKPEKNQENQIFNQDIQFIQIQKQNDEKIFEIKQEKYKEKEIEQKSQFNSNQRKNYKYQKQCYGQQQKIESHINLQNSQFEKQLQLNLLQITDNVNIASQQQINFDQNIQSHNSMQQNNNLTKNFPLNQNVNLQQNQIEKTEQVNKHIQETTQKKKKMKIESNAFENKF